METISVESLKKDASFTGDLILDSSFILLPQSAQLTEGMISDLKTWGFENVLCDGNISLGGDIGISKEVEENFSPKNTTDKLSNTVKQAIEDSKHIQIGKSDDLRMKMVTGIYDEYMNYIENVFSFYTTHKQIDEDDLSEAIQALCMFIKEHKRYILRVNPSSEKTNKNFLVTHSMRTTVLALAIGMQLHLPLSKMIDLGKTCILHEIGMLRLPPQLYMTDRKLSAIEKNQITKHTLFGYQIVKNLNFSVTIQLGILQHHEKESGNGYPQKLTGDKISSIAKIIAVACSYEAISSPRSFRDERSTFEAIVEMIQNQNKQYDDSVIKALLYTVSLYPIGSYVYLSNKKVAMVVDTNPDNPKFPVCQLLTETEADGSYKIIHTSPDETSVVRILTKQERNDILKLALEKQQNKPVQNESAISKPVAPVKKAESPASASKKVDSATAENSSNGTVEVDINIFS